MKKFTDSINEKQNHYSGDQKLYNEIYNLIEETLTPKMDGKDSERISLIGKESLVNELSKIVQNEITKTKISVLENFKSEPTMIKENIEVKDVLSDMINETISNETYYWGGNYADGSPHTYSTSDSIMKDLLESIQEYFGQKAESGNDPWIPVKLWSNNKGSFIVMIVAEDNDNNTEIYELAMSGPKDNYDESDFTRIDESDIDDSFEIVWENADGLVQ